MIEQENKQFDALYVNHEIMGNAVIVYEYAPSYQRMSFHNKNNGEVIGTSEMGSISEAQRQKWGFEKQAETDGVKIMRRILLENSQKWLEGIAA